MEKAKVYFTKEITPTSFIKMYETLGKKLEGNVAVKLHSGEKGRERSNIENEGKKQGDRAVV